MNLKEQEQTKNTKKIGHKVGMLCIAKLKDS